MSEGPRRASQSNQPRLVVLVTTLSAFTVSSNVSMVNVAIPALAATLDISLPLATWIQTSFLLALTVALPITGRFADEANRRQAMSCGLLLFTVAAACASVAPTTAVLLIGRALQGVAAGFIWSLNVPLIVEAFPATRRGRILGMYLISVALGKSIGPYLGGLLVDYMNWRWVFAISIPISLSALALTRGLNATPTSASEGSNFSAAAILGAGFATLLVSITYAPLWGWTNTRIVFGLSLSLLLLLTFVASELRSNRPLFQRELYNNRLLVTANLTALVAHVGTFASALLVAAYLQVVVGMSATAAGLYLLVQFGLAATIGPIAGAISDKYGSRALTTVGLISCALGLASLARLSVEPTLGSLLSSLGLIGVGLAAFSSPNTSAIMSAVHNDQHGSAAGALATFRTLGQAASVAILGAIAAYRLGPEGNRSLFTSSRLDLAEVQFAAGFRVAMLAAAMIALLAAGLAFLRGKGEIEARRLD